MSGYYNNTYPPSAFFREACLARHERTGRKGFWPQRELPTWKDFVAATWKCLPAGVNHFDAIAQTVAYVIIVNFDGMGLSDETRTAYQQQVRAWRASIPARAQMRVDHWIDQMNELESISKEADELESSPFVLIGNTKHCKTCFGADHVRVWQHDGPCWNNINEKSAVQPQVTCTRCGDTGTIDTRNNDLPCACAAGDTAAFRIAGRLVLGEQLKRVRTTEVRERLEEWCNDEEKYLRVLTGQVDNDQDQGW